MNRRVVADLRLRHAALVEQAERKRQSWRTLPTGAKSLALGKEVKELDAMVADYAAVIEFADRKKDT